jgi:hypothetical protein
VSLRAAVRIAAIVFSLEAQSTLHLERPQNMYRSRQTINQLISNNMNVL